MSNLYIFLSDCKKIILNIVQILLLCSFLLKNTLETMSFIKMSAHAKSNGSCRKWFRSFKNSQWSVVQKDAIQRIWNIATIVK